MLRGAGPSISNNPFRQVADRNPAFAFLAPVSPETDSQINLAIQRSLDDQQQANENAARRDQDIPHPRPAVTSSSSHVRGSSPPLPPIPEPRREDSLPEASADPPPAYSEMPKPEEASVEYGPSRPFQQVRVQPSWPSNLPPGQNAGWPQPRPTHQQQLSWTSSPNGTPSIRPPPPRHPSAIHTSSPSAHLNTPPPQQHPPNSPSSPSVRQSVHVPDESQPTSVPMGGRPLLRDGMVLVYPDGMACHKCNNTGYKSFDPSHPCRKCWARYGRPYSGALIHAPRGPGFQRPLPAGRPQAAPRGLPGAWPESGVNGRALGSGGGGSGSPVFPTRAPRQVHVVDGRPPPGALVVMPGDRRIGGRLCPTCDGEGVVALFFFDSETCETCGGLGRIHVS